MSTVVERRMNCRYVSIDPSTNVLPAAARWFVDQFAVGTELNLSSIIVAVPTSRGCRRLLEILVELCERHSYSLLPPQITTVGHLPESFYQHQLPLASALTQRLAWTEAIGELSTEQIQLIGPAAPENMTWSDRFGLANMIARLHRELAGSLYSFKDVIQIASEVPSFQQHDRWQVLYELQQSYFKRLRDAKTWDVQTARRFAVQNNECTTDKQVVCVGTVDINRALKAMLQQVEPQVTFLVPQADETSAGFDEFGCLKPTFWEQYRVDVPDESIRTADRPSDQARVVVDFLGRVGKKFSAADVSVAVPDPQLTSFMTRALRSAGVGAHDSSGTAIVTGPAFRLFKLATDWIASHRFDDFANLVRHEYVYEQVNEQVGDPDWLLQLDRFNERNLPARITPGPRSGDSLLDQIIQSVFNLFSDVIDGPKDKSLTTWASCWRAVFKKIFGSLEVDRTDELQKRLIKSVSTLNDALLELEKSGETWERTCSIENCRDMVMSIVEDIRHFTDRSPEDVELLGWLDLMWDDAQVAVVTAFNEGKIPSANTRYPFLSNTLRGRLGLIDNQMRFARDKFALSLLLQNRKKVLLIGGRRDAFENPLLPSRLWFSGDAQRDAKRMLQLIHFAESRTAAKIDRRAPEKQQFEIPCPEPVAEPQEMWATEFDAYLVCPYRYYLEKKLRLRAIESRIDELDPAKFGSIAHAALEAFGNSEVRSSTSVKEIEAYLHEELDRQFAEKKWGENSALPAIRIQRAQLQMRFSQFAKKQAERCAAGWQIVQTETDQYTRELDVDGRVVIIRGRIDRVDYHEEKQQYALIDYKTGATSMRKQFQIRKKVWLSLQLPLYQWIFAGTGVTSEQPLKIGFAKVGSSLDEIKFDLGVISTDQLDIAIDAAKDVVRNIRLQNFRPNPNPPYSNALDAICQSSVFEKWELAEGENSWPVP